MVLTDADEEACRYPNAVFQQIVETAAIIADLGRLELGTPQVAMASTGNYFAAGLPAGFRQRCPGVYISLTLTIRK